MPGSSVSGAVDVEAVRRELAADLDRARARTTTLTSVVDDADLTRQHSPLMSPLVWDLAHIGNQEELWLLRRIAERPGLLPDGIDELYDAFRHPRKDRPRLPLLDPASSRRYVQEVRDRVTDLLDAVVLDSPDPLLHQGFAFAMIAQHEQQHVETMLATHQLRAGETVLTAPAPPAGHADLPAEVIVPAGEFEMGTDLDPWALDNERPAHRVHVPGFAIDTVPVRNADWIEFIAAGGYRRPELWTAAGWDRVQSAGLVAPEFWAPAGDGWTLRRFGATVPVPPDEPVQHVCWYEADAYARWRGRRLPTETEWEKAARHDPATGRSRRYPWGDETPGEQHANLGGRHLGPAEVGAYPGGVSPLGVHQLIGDVWEWTSSDFRGYPGFQAFPYREYSEVFFGSEYKVLRGGSWAVDPVACRGTFRNWDYPIRRQIFAGLRTARDLRVGES
jgi:iron(II)-dependent oxidoreductase